MSILAHQAARARPRPLRRSSPGAGRGGGGAEAQTTGRCRTAGVRQRPVDPSGRVRSGATSRAAHFFLPVLAAYSNAARGVSVCGMPMMSRREIMLVTQPATTEALRPKVGIA